MNRLEGYGAVEIERFSGNLPDLYLRLHLAQRDSNTLIVMCLQLMHLDIARLSLFI